MLFGLLLWFGIIWCSIITFRLGRRSPGHPHWKVWHQWFWFLAIGCGGAGLIGALASHDLPGTALVITEALGTMIGFIFVAGLASALAWCVGRILRKPITAAPPGTPPGS
jgi:hypothetical protein